MDLLAVVPALALVGRALAQGLAAVVQVPAVVGQALAAEVQDLMAVAAMGVAAAVAVDISSQAAVLLFHKVCYAGIVLC